jgi:hypothetical protein
MVPKIEGRNHKVKAVPPPRLRSPLWRNGLLTSLPKHVVVIEAGQRLNDWQVFRCICLHVQARPARQAAFRRSCDGGRDFFSCIIL